MNHALILPILLPMFVGSLLLFAPRLSLTVQRSLSLFSTLLLGLSHSQRLCGGKQTNMVSREFVS